MTTSEFGPATDDPRRALDGTIYRFVSLLGSGAMGEVIEAEHAKLGTRVAVKLLKNLPLDAGDLARMEDRMRIEAQACARLDHPNLLKVLDFGVTPLGRTFLVSERLIGRTLRAEFEERKFLPVAEAIAIAGAVLAGLSAAHGAGVAHRDVKPDNIFLTNAPPGVSRGVKLLDFGLAKVVDAARDPSTPAPLSIPTATGMSLGTPRFMAPEQATGKRQVDRRVDIYSVGGVLYAMLAGRGPFDHHRTVYEIMTAQVAEVPAPPSRHALQPIPPDLDRAILKALAKDPEQRFQSAREFADELHRIAGNLHRASQVPPPPTQSPPGPTRWDRTEFVDPPPRPPARPGSERPTVKEGILQRPEPIAPPQPRPASIAPPQRAWKGTELIADDPSIQETRRVARESFPSKPSVGPTVDMPPSLRASAHLPNIPPTVDMPPSALRASYLNMTPTLESRVSSIPPSPRKRPSRQRMIVVLSVIAILCLGVAAAILIMRL